MNGFIFDLDGTLLNSIADIGNALNTVLERFGLPTHPLSTYQNFVGNGMPKLVERATPLDYQDDKNILAHFFEAYGQCYCVQSTLYDGVYETLQMLNNQKIPIAICTNKKQEYTDKIIAHYLKNIEFISVIGDRSDGQQNPNPHYPLIIADEMHCAPRDCYFVGDSNVDMQTAKNAGMKAIGVSWGFRSITELEESGALRIIHQFKEILDL